VSATPSTTWLYTPANSAMRCLGPLLGQWPSGFHREKSSSADWLFLSPSSHMATDGTGVSPSLTPRPTSPSANHRRSTVSWPERRRWMLLWVLLECSDEESSDFGSRLPCERLSFQRRGRRETSSSSTCGRGEAPARSELEELRQHVQRHLVRVHRPAQHAAAAVAAAPLHPARRYRPMAAAVVPRYSKRHAPQYAHQHHEPQKPPPNPGLYNTHARFAVSYALSSSCCVCSCRHGGNPPAVVSMSAESAIRQRMQGRRKALAVYNATGYTPARACTPQTSDLAWASRPREASWGPSLRVQALSGRPHTFGRACACDGTLPRPLWRADEDGPRAGPTHLSEELLVGLGRAHALHGHYAR
jgi:hypothetical protein